MKFAAPSARRGRGFLVVFEGHAPSSPWPPGSVSEPVDVIGGGVVGWVVAVAGPRGEDEEYLGALLARDAVTFPWLEGEQRAWLRFNDARSRFDVR